MLNIDNNGTSFIYVPLTKPTSKFRVKFRESETQYGNPVATRQNTFDTKHYIEWQIGYDTMDQNNTSYNNLNFIGANGKIKYLYELSEIIYYLKSISIIKSVDIVNLIEKLSSLEDKFIDNTLEITRDSFIKKSILGINFKSSYVNYPLFICNLNNDFIIEIIVREKQRAVGVQPMLYVCFPITKLLTNTQLIGRKADPKETGILVIEHNDANIYLKIIEIFGMLSKKHHDDVLKILEIIKS